MLTHGPVAFWTLAGGSAGLTDRSGHGRTATAFNGYAVTSFFGGQKATEFDGESQYVEVPDDDALSVPATGILTIEAWMRPDVLQFSHDEQSGYVHWMGKGTPNQYEYVARMYSLATTEIPPRPNRISGYAFNPMGRPAPAVFSRTQ